MIRYTITGGYKVLCYRDGSVKDFEPVEQVFETDGWYTTLEAACCFADKNILPGKEPIICGSNDIRDIVHFCYKVYEEVRDKNDKLVNKYLVDEYDTLDDYLCIFRAFFNAVDSHRKGGCKSVEDGLKVEITKIRQVNVDGDVFDCFSCYNSCNYGHFCAIKRSDDFLSHAKLPSPMCRYGWNIDTPEEKLIDDIRYGQWWSIDDASNPDDIFWAKNVDDTIRGLSPFSN